MDNFRFLKWKVYDDAKSLISDSLKIYKTLPREICYSIGDQLVRSVLSISLNIAEGSGKDSDKELNRFFNIAIGSAYETLANIDILKVNNFISEKDFQNIFKKIQEIVKQLGGFKKKLT